MANNKSISKKAKDFIDYIFDKMPLERRNAMEKQWQKDNFAQEAAEGFAGMEEEQAISDIEAINQKIRASAKRQKKSYVFPYRTAIAAGIALLLLSGISYYLLQQTTTLQPPRLVHEVIKEEPAKKSEPAKTAPTAPVAPIAEEEIPPAKPQEAEPTPIKREAPPVIRAEEKTAAAEPEERDFNIDAQKIFQELVFAEIAVDTTESENMQLDIPHSETANLIMEEKIPGIPINAKMKDADSSIRIRGRAGSAAHQPEPVGGMQAYMEYLQTVALLPDTAQISQTQIAVSFSVDIKGEMSDFKTIDISGSGEFYEKKAIDIIKQGPSWQAAEKNGIKVKAPIILIIEFGKP